MLNEIVSAGAVGLHIGQQLGHHVQLMIPGEDHALGFDFAGLFVPLLLQMEVFLQDLQQAILAQHVLPQVGGVIAVRVDGVAPAAHVSGPIAALVERQKIGLGSFQPGGHVHIGQVHSKVNEHAIFELENRVLARPIESILLDGVGGVLPGELAFQLHRHHRDAVEEQDNVDAVLTAQGVVELPGAVKDVGGILGLTGLVDGGFWLPEHDPELDAPVGEALAQHFQEAHLLHFPAEAVDELPLAVGAVDLLKPCPLLGLAGADEGEERADVQRLFPVKGGGVALLITAMGQEVFLNILLKAFFFVVKVRHGYTYFLRKISFEYQNSSIKSMQQ